MKIEGNTTNNSTCMNLIIYMKWTNFSKSKAGPTLKNQLIHAIILTAKEEKSHD